MNSRFVSKFDDEYSASRTESSSGAPAPLLGRALEFAHTLSRVDAALCKIALAADLGEAPKHLTEVRAVLERGLEVIFRLLPRPPLALPNLDADEIQLARHLLAGVLTLDNGKKLSAAAEQSQDLDFLVRQLLAGLQRGETAILAAAVQFKAQNMPSTLKRGRDEQEEEHQEEEPAPQRRRLSLTALEAYTLFSMALGLKGLYDLAS